MGGGVGVGGGIQSGTAISCGGPCAPKGNMVVSFDHFHLHLLNPALTQDITLRLAAVNTPTLVWAHPNLPSNLDPNPTSNPVTSQPPPPHTHTLPTPRSPEDAFKNSVESITGPITRIISRDGILGVYNAFGAEDKKVFEQAYSAAFKPSMDICYEIYQVEYGDGGDGGGYVSWEGGQGEVEARRQWDAPCCTPSHMPRPPAPPGRGLRQ
jgi:hypothetical protein